jgi:hypothetical protein
LRLIAQESYVEVASMVIIKSPVDESVFRNNWFSALNSPSTQTTTTAARKGFGERGGARFTEFLHLSTSFDIGDQLYLTNALPYARRLEYGWSSTMAPNGMVRVSVAQWPLIVARLARRIR